MKLKKTFMLIILGIGYGYLSFWWLVFSLASVFPGTSPGSRDWEEDMLFIPVGYIMFIVYGILGGIIVMQNRKDKKNLFLFLISALLMGVLIYLFSRIR